ncbi:MAG: sigma-E processing peptidase SpoIIGA, partial [Clostridia bacterium]|nr:sigma-E processing peptidase SpoIIGA [Clostridia bacterium]
MGRLLAVLLLDLLHNALALMMALCMLNSRIRAGSIFFAAFSGAAAAFFASIAHFSRFGSMLLWLPVSVMMMRLAAGREEAIIRSFRRAAVLLACEGFLGGVVLALYGATGSLPAAHFISAAFTAAVFVGTMKEKEAALDRRVRIICRFAGQSVSFDAVVDTGNTLRDYLTQRPVIVAGQKQLDAVRAIGIHMRLIAADTAGGRRLMQMAMPEETIVETGGNRFRVEAA